jgi:2-amino-4-hydroxy-6-hydroxymethyldihydropteridine diphosphokinase
MNVVVGVGAAGAHAERNVSDGIARLAAHPSMRVVGVSRLYQNPAFGGATTERFVNAAIVVDTSLSLEALLRSLHATERALGRVRGIKNSARPLDLDVLWSLDAIGPARLPVVPHPHVLQRASAVVPAVEAIERAGLVVPQPLRAAARALASAVMTVVA